VTSTGFHIGGLSAVYAQYLGTLLTAFGPAYRSNVQGFLGGHINSLPNVLFCMQERKSQGHNGRVFGGHVELYVSLAYDKFTTMFGDILAGRIYMLLSYAFFFE